MTRKIEIDIDYDPELFGLAAIIPFPQNECCNRKYILLTENPRWDGSKNYSCQCACGDWCTGGHDLPELAVAEYQKMCQRKRAYLNSNAQSGGDDAHGKDELQ